MRKILFLDFDGVLHPDGGTHLFGRLGALEELLLEWNDVEIVISSSWRETHPYDELLSRFDSRIKPRVLGVTPSLESGYEKGGRQREVEAFLQGLGLNQLNASWAALDDTAHFFDDDCKFLILVDPALGVNEDTFQKLTLWYQRIRYSVTHHKRTTVSRD